MLSFAKAQDGALPGRGIEALVNSVHVVTPERGTLKPLNYTQETIFGFNLQPYSRPLPYSRLATFHTETETLL